MYVIMNNSRVSRMQVHGWVSLLTWLLQTTRTSTWVAVWDGSSLPIPQSSGFVLLPPGCWAAGRGHCQKGCDFPADAGVLLFLQVEGITWDLRVWKWAESLASTPRPRVLPRFTSLTYWCGCDGGRLEADPLEAQEPFWLTQRLPKGEVEAKVVLSPTPVFYICFLA